MPIYEYACRQCGHRFERRQSFQDEAIRVCPDCGGETYRVFQPVGVIFKGSGWYSTESRKATDTDGAATVVKGGSDKGGSSEKVGAGEKGSATPAAAEGASAPPAAAATTPAPATTGKADSTAT